MSAPGWHPDPAGSEQLRWWDGSRWTEHLHPLTAHPEPGVATPNDQGGVSPEEPRRRKPKRTWFVVTAIAVIVALVAGLGVLGVNAVTGLLGFDRVIALPTKSAPVADRDYEATEPLLDISSKSSFSFPADYDFDARNGEGSAYSWAFELFLDPALTSRTDIFVWQDSPGAELSIRPSETSFALSVFGGTVDLMSEGADYQSWGLEPEYYLVRHVDADGETLPAPVVTKITTEAPAMKAPAVKASADAETGSMLLNWAPVEGATEYIVVGSFAQVTDDSEGRLYKVLATTPGTEWSSVNDVDQTRSDPNQNAHLAFFDGQSADDMLGSGADSPDSRYETSAYRWGVIATNGTDYSRVATADATAVVAGLPFEAARHAMGGTTSIFSLDEVRDLPTTFAFTSVDGRTRGTQAIIPEGGIFENDMGSLVFTIEGVGTTLSFSIDWVLPDEDFDAEAFRVDFNARAAASVPTTGGTTLISKSLAEVKVDSTPEVDEAVVDFPVYGSDEYVRFIAGHIIAGSSLIDITRFADAPGAQSTYDALSEAAAQNPYAVGLGGYDTIESYGERRVLLRIDYAMAEDERRGIQQTISDSVAQVISSVVTDGMSDRDKAVALNDWVTGNTEYDYPALAASDNGDDLEPFGYAWRADGVFTQGSAVCGGYAMTYNALMNEAGVPTVYVTGDVLDGGRHAWNKVYIDGAWLAVDTTWNDTDGGNRYLLISDSEFTAEATRTEDTEWIRDDLLAAYAAG